MAKVIIRPTIPADLSTVIAEPLPFRIRAYTAVLKASTSAQPSPQDGPSASAQEGETVLGVGGIAYPPDGPPIAFVQQAPGAKDYPVSFHRAGLMAMAMIRETGVREVMATCDADNEAAIRWLKRLGFALAERQTLPPEKLLWFWTRRD